MPTYQITSPVGLLDPSGRCLINILLILQTKGHPLSIHPLYLDRCFVISILTYLEYYNDKLNCPPELAVLLLLLLCLKIDRASLWKYLNHPSTKQRHFFKNLIFEYIVCRKLHVNNKTKSMVFLVNDVCVSSKHS